jgi:hypothetical protein
MTAQLPHAPTTAHSLTDTAVFAALATLALVAFVAAASAPVTAATVLVTAAAVLTAQRAHRVLTDRGTRRTRAGSPTTPRHAPPK